MSVSVMPGAIDRLANNVDLTADEAGAVLREVMAGEVSETQTAAFLMGLRVKGETVAEIVGLARTMRELAAPVTVARKDLLDTAGTGGGRRTFNVSTTAAFVAAGAGCAVAKHGNRSATSQSGSADLLEALGARIDLAPEAVAECIESVGFGFMFAPRHHAATRYVVPVRKELAVRTVFNFLGPLTNPAGATRQLIGVFDPAHLETMATALHQLGGVHALVVSSEDGLDEVSVSGPTHVFELRDGRVEGRSVTPAELGLDTVTAETIPAGDPAFNAGVTRRVLAGNDGPERTLVLANAGAAIYVAGAASTLEQGVRAAEVAIDSGAAEEALARYVERTRELAVAA